MEKSVYSLKQILELFREIRDNLMHLLTEKPIFYPEVHFRKTLSEAYRHINKGGYGSVITVSNEKEIATLMSKNLQAICKHFLQI